MPSIGASSSSSIWESIDWTTMEKHVRRLRMRIAKAAREQGIRVRKLAFVKA